MPGGRHVHPDLVGPPGLEADREQGGETERLQGVVVRDAGSTVGHDAEPVVGTAQPPDGGVDRASRRVRVSLHQCVVGLDDLTVTELALEVGIGRVGLGDDHDPAGADIEAVDDPLPLRSAGISQGVSRGAQATHHGGPVPARTGMGRHPDRLVDSHDVVVLVQDHQPLDRARRRGGNDCGQLDLQPGPRR